MAVTAAAAWPHSITPSPGEAEQQSTAHTWLRREELHFLAVQGSWEYTGVSPQTSISMNNLPFVTKAAQIQVPHPPTLTKIIFKRAAEPEPLPMSPLCSEEECSLSQHTLLDFKLGKPELLWPQRGPCSRLLLAVSPQFPAGKQFHALVGIFFLAVFSCLVSDGLKAPRDLGKLACARTNLLFTETQL